MDLHSPVCHNRVAITHFIIFQNATDFTSTLEPTKAALTAAETHHCCQKDRPDIRDQHLLHPTHGKKVLIPHYWFPIILVEVDSEFVGLTNLLLVQCIRFNFEMMESSFGVVPMGAMFRYWMTSDSKLSVHLSKLIRYLTNYTPLSKNKKNTR